MWLEPKSLLVKGLAKQVVRGAVEDHNNGTYTATYCSNNAGGLPALT